jgi:signal peptidase I
MKKLFKGLGVIFLIVVLFFIFFDINKAAGPKMDPLIKDGQYFLVLRYWNSNTLLSRGEVVVYYPQDNNNQSHLGKIWALPTESIRVQDENFYLDDNNTLYKVTEGYQESKKPFLASPDRQWIKLNKNEYLILKQDYSSQYVMMDEHLIPRGNVLGRVVYIF